MCKGRGGKGRGGVHRGEGRNQVLAEGTPTRVERSLWRGRLSIVGLTLGLEEIRYGGEQWELRLQDSGRAALDEEGSSDAESITQSLGSG